MSDKPVRVRFVRDLPSAVQVGDFKVPQSRGPVKQRQARAVGGPHPLSTETVEVELAPADELVVPADVARVLEEGGYVEKVAEPADADPLL